MSEKRRDVQLAELLQALGYSKAEAAPTGLATSAVLTRSRRCARQHQVLQVEIDGDDWRVTRHETDGSEWDTTQASGTGGLEAALADEPDLLVLPANCVTYWATDEGKLPSHVLLTRLIVDIADVAGPTGSEAQDLAAWTEEDEDILSLFPGTDWVTLRGRINGTRVAALRAIDDKAEPAIPVLVDVDEGQLEPIEDIAMITWFSESGGAPISWDGGNSLSRLNGPIGYARQWGDYGTENEVITLPDDQGELAQVVADWILKCEAAVAAALAFEPLDPTGTLSDKDRAEWESLLTAPEIEVTVDLPADTVDSMRARLSVDLLYRVTKEALQDPSSGLGQALRAALEDLEESGVLGLLLNGEWSVATNSTAPVEQVLPDGRRVTQLSAATVTEGDRAREAMVQGWLDKGYGVAVYGVHAPTRYSLLLSYGGEGAYLPADTPPESAPGYLSGGDCPPLRGVIPPIRRSGAGSL
jgi:hypothetical protein